MITVYKDCEFGWVCWDCSENVQEVKNDALKSFKVWHENAKKATEDRWRETCQRYKAAAKLKYKTARTMTLAEYHHKHNAFYLEQEPEEITEERYNDLLSVLPPRIWRGRGFQLSERTSGTITQECYKEGGKYYIHYVDITDPTTWKI